MLRNDESLLGLAFKALIGIFGAILTVVAVVILLPTATTDHNLPVAGLGIILLVFGFTSMISAILLIAQPTQGPILLTREFIPRRKK